MPPKQDPQNQSQSPQKQEQPQKQQEQQKKEEVQEKQLRRVAERAQMPTDKAELIQYLSSRIKQAEEALADTEQLLEQEVKERQKVQKSLDERNNQLSKLYEVDQRALPQKIKQKLNEILTTTVTQKIQAQEKLNQQKSRNYEFKARYEELKWQDQNNKAKLEEQEEKQKNLATEIEKMETQNKQMEEQLQQKTSQFNQLKEKKESLENQYLQMKVAMERMGDIRGVLNRFFGNQDLFDDKMNLKEQKVVRPPQPLKETPLPPSREKSRQGNNTQRLKPISRIKNDDDDFWRADFKSKNPAY